MSSQLLSHSLVASLSTQPMPPPPQGLGGTKNPDIQASRPLLAWLGKSRQVWTRGQHGHTLKYNGVPKHQHKNPSSASTVWAIYKYLYIHIYIYIYTISLSCAHIYDILYIYIDREIYISMDAVQ